MYGFPSQVSTECPNIVKISLTDWRRGCSKPAAGDWGLWETTWATTELHQLRDVSSLLCGSRGDWRSGSTVFTFFDNPFSLHYCPYHLQVQALKAEEGERGRSLRGARCISFPSMQPLDSSSRMRSATMPSTKNIAEAERSVNDFLSSSKG